MGYGICIAIPDLLSSARISLWVQGQKILNCSSFSQIIQQLYPSMKSKLSLLWMKQSGVLSTASDTDLRSLSPCSHKEYTRLFPHATDAVQRGCNSAYGRIQMLKFYIAILTQKRHLGRTASNFWSYNNTNLWNSRIHTGRGGPGISTPKTPPPQRK